MSSSSQSAAAEAEAAAAEEETKMILLKSSDGETFEIKEKAARLSKTLENMIEENWAVGAIPLPSIKAVTLEKVIEFCNKHADFVPGEEGERILWDWDANFVDVDYPILFDYILAANFLEIRSLLDLAIQKVADMIRGKTPEEIRALFNISTQPWEEDPNTDDLYPFN